MNVIKIYGGLGNQMFQYAFGRAMQLRGSDVAFDISWFNKPSTEVPRPYGLSRFRVSPKISPLLSQPVVHEDASTYYRYIADYLTKENTNFFGYWQNQQYIQPILPTLKEEFKLRKDQEFPVSFIQLREVILQKECVAIHIRRGDYLTKGHHLLPIEYYTTALLETGNSIPIVFSDDIPWCRQYFKGAFFVEEPDYLSFDLMRLCKHKITANSTYSWWAAMLGKEDGKIFAPKRWRLNDTEESTIEEEKFIPDNWIRL